MVARRRALLAAVALVAATARCGDGPTAPGAGAAGSITAADIRHRVGLLADDSMRGRWTPSPELEKVAAYIAGEFARLGLRGAGPAGDMVWRYPVVGGSAPNVIGVLDGGDSGLAGEVVLVVAHMDHKGVDVPVNGDSIYNGADDNASGTAGMLEIAEAFAELSPRRTIAFIAFSGEERGLWGSTNYVGDPAIPLAQTAAVINLDMISRNDPGSVGVTGLDSSSLGGVFAEVARAHRELGLAALPFVDVGRSDHQPFAQRAVPYLLFFAGLHQDYHRPSDTVDRINSDKAARVARLAFYSALEIANQATRPVWHAPAAR
jgi:Zn-dependent M28 family amino/carboxypeptidase